MRLHEDTITQVRERAKILDQFEGTQLKRVGLEFAARCPWHDDRRPSLSISPQKGFAYCHVCAKGVDAIGWVQDQHGLSFTEAVTHLAERYNVEVKPANPEDAEKIAQRNAERSALYAKRSRQEADFHAALFSSPEAKSYLRNRGLSKETVVAWGIGWNAGAQRLMVPLRDPQGRTIAFTGRVLGEQKPKYKNSCNDILFNKSELVFGLDKARPEIVRSGRVIITEGQFDVIRLWQEGIRNVVAVSGSSLTPGMVEKLVRSTRLHQVLLCFDGDLGGAKAAERAITALQEFALRGELDLQILMLPAGKDPADCAEEFERLRTQSISWVEHLVEAAVARIDPSDPATIASAEQGVKQILRILPEGALRAWVRQRAQDVLRVVPMVSPAKLQTQREIDRGHWAERRALRLYFHTTRADHIQALSLLEYRDPMLAKAWTLIRMLQAMGTSHQAIPQVLAKVLKRDEALYDVIRPLLRPIPEVLRVITANPQEELEQAWNVLMPKTYHDSNSNSIGVSLPHHAPQTAGMASSATAPA